MMDGQKIPEPINYWPMLRRVLFLLLTLLALVCALVGSWQLYAPQAEYPELLCSAVLFSTFKLFTFSPTAGPVDMVPTLYLVAMWLAPFCTTVAVFRLAESYVRRSLGALSLFFRSYTLVYGWHPDSVRLIENLQRPVRLLRRKVLLLAEVPLPLEQRLALERSGVTVAVLSLAEGNGAARDARLRALCLSHAESIVLYAREPQANFSAFVHLSEYLAAHKLRKEKPLCAFFCEDEGLEPLITEYQQEQERKQTAQLDLKCFSVADLVARSLFQEHSPYQLNSERLDWSKPVSERRLTDFGESHLLIVGLGSCGEQVLLRALNPGSLIPNHKPRVTVLDRAAEERIHHLKAKYRCLDQTCELDFQTVDVHSDKLLTDLSALKDSVTYAVVCLEDPAVALWTVRVLAEALPGVPLGVRLDSGADLCNYLKHTDGVHAHVFPFGMRKDILTRELVIDAELDEAAIRFYSQYQAHAGQAQTPDWAGLSLFKKDSTRAQAAFQATLERIAAKYLLEGVSLSPLQEAVDRGDADALLCFLRAKEGAPFSQLAQLEHRRWCVFMYLHNYYAPSAPGPENALRHPCLIDDWDELCRSKAGKPTLRYDLIPLLLSPGSALSQ